MKTTVTTLILVLFAVVLNAQDTLFLKKNKTIPCIVTEIGVDEIKYKDYSNLEGPVYVVRKVDVMKIVFKNGKVEYIEPDEMDMNKEEEILDKNQAIKVAFLSPLYNHVQITYERKLKMTKNLETRLGFIGIGNREMFDDNRQGAYFAGGVKFLLGQDYYIKGMKYLHPLKGSYLKPEICISIFDFSEEVPVWNSNYYYSNYRAFAKYRASLVAFNMVYGKQYILGNTLTFDFHVGIGIGAASVFKKNNINNDVNYEPSNYGYAVIVSRDFPLTFTSGISIGYIFK